MSSDGVAWVLAQRALHEAVKLRAHAVAHGVRDEASAELVRERARAYAEFLPAEDRISARWAAEQMAYRMQLAPCERCAAGEGKHRRLRPPQIARIAELADV